MWAFIFPEPAFGPHRQASCPGALTERETSQRSLTKGEFPFGQYEAITLGDSREAGMSVNGPFALIM